MKYTPKELELIPVIQERKCIVESADYWFKSARKLQTKSGAMADAFCAMENALNHTENALAACLRIMTPEQCEKVGLKKLE